MEKPWESSPQLAVISTRVIKELMKNRRTPGPGGGNPLQLLAKVVQGVQEKLPRDPRLSFVSS